MVKFTTKTYINSEFNLFFILISLRQVRQKSKTLMAYLRYLPDQKRYDNVCSSLLANDVS